MLMLFLAFESQHNILISRSRRKRPFISIPTWIHFSVDLPINCFCKLKYYLPILVLIATIILHRPLKDGDYTSSIMSATYTRAHRLLTHKNIEQPAELRTAGKRQASVYMTSLSLPSTYLTTDKLLNNPLVTQTSVSSLGSFFKKQS